MDELEAHLRRESGEAESDSDDEEGIFSRGSDIGDYIPVERLEDDESA